MSEDNMGVGNSAVIRRTIRAGLAFILLILILTVGSCILLMDDNDLVAIGDDSSNGELMDTKLYLAGTGDDLSLWPIGPDEHSIESRTSLVVNERVGAGYSDPATWGSMPLDKDLRVEGKVRIVFYVNATEDIFADARFRVTVFGEVHETEYFDMNTGIIPIGIDLDVTGWEGMKDERISMSIEVDLNGLAFGNNFLTINIHK